jgi:hypothetical protein
MSFINKILESIRVQLNGFIEIKPKRQGIYQLFLPAYYPDGDMLDIYLTQLSDDSIRISDYGLTMMRLSYSFEIDTSNKERILKKILNESNMFINNDSIYLDTTIDSLYISLMQFIQTEIKIFNMRLYRREIIQSMFYELLDDFINEKLYKYNPVKSYYPIEKQDEYEVDYCFNSRVKPIFLFGVHNTDKARLATISCQHFKNENIKFSSMIIFEDYERIAKKDFKRIMTVAEKMYPNYDDFINNIEEYLIAN